MSSLAFVTTEKPPTPDPIKPGQPVERPQAVPLWSSDVLFDAHPFCVIEHGGVYYRLLQTRNGKLLLTK